MELPVVEKLTELVRNGTESDVRGYIHDHWNEFPLSAQDMLSAALLVDGMRRDMRSPEALNEFQDSIVSAIEQIVDAK